MKIKFEKDMIDKTVEDVHVETLTAEDVFGNDLTKTMSIDKFIDISNLFEYYDANDMTELLNRLDNIQLPDLTNDFSLLGKFQKINGIKSVTDTSVAEITEKYYEVRTAINSVLEIRKKYILYKQNWDELITFVKNLYDRKKDSMMLKKELSDYKNQDLRTAKVNEWLAGLLKQKDRMIIANVRIKQFYDEIIFTLEYLQDVNSEISRIQSAIVLALDTGEISKVKWQN